MKAFNELTATDVRSIVAGDSALASAQTQSRLFYEGDHLQSGVGWIGPGPAIDATGWSTFYALLKDRFVFKNVIRRAVDSKVNAALGRAPQWGTAPKEARPVEDEAIDAWKARYEPLQAQYDAALSYWWDKRAVHSVLMEFATRYEVEGRATLRLYVPPDLLTIAADGSATIDKKVDLQTSLMRLYVEAPANDQSRTTLNRRSMAHVGIYLFKEDVEIDGQVTATNRAELTYVDEKGATVLRVVGEESKNGTFASEADALELGGNLWHFQAEGEPLVTASVRALQKLHNLAQNVKARNLSDAGWPETWEINTMTANQFAAKENEAGNPITDQLTATPATVQRGPGRNQHRVSESVLDGENGRTVFPANVLFRDPVSPENAIKTCDDSENAILDECHQSHLKSNGSDANRSGDSFKQERADFEMNLGRSVAKFNEAGRWVLETALAIAFAWSNETVNPLELLRIDFNCRVDIGPATGEEIREGRENVNAGTLSRETYQSRILDIDDTDAENARIESEAQANSAAQLKAAQALEYKWKAASAAQMAGVSRNQSLRDAGLTDEEITAMDEEQFDFLTSDKATTMPQAEMASEV